MKKLLFILVLYSATAFGQEKSRKTLKFSIIGEVEKESVITLDSLKQYTIRPIGDIKVTDHTGAFKHQDEELKGILLKDVLSHTRFKTPSPKLLSRFYFACTGTDGYTVVYSWNELYNTTVGNQVCIIIEKNGIKADKMPESLQMTSAGDFKTGRRYLHNLDKIIVSQVQ
ncbi:hypothetical protein [Mucilaginibacter phyllosphaerae]|uniref:Molybdopterin-binding protein n=1 Tax=Mucilaginibacter phyllosphaerae TaxID=1812349 RepID=A0A4Y8AF67_9SPHI|nr:hypothetical protein [Mucilaginibacter phyllosphaerae]MBB3970297.1 hypothetical protein [Mucilaginibacter phyllosphaerae]TEW66669.1 hypothetical protein E2R65_09630 [Mucilaginibacter phyllosphaerae]GGH11133.1 hypothetical protein GCM10007352_17220 [Mucilaginibacter phyllosphaerae]